MYNEYEMLWKRQTTLLWHVLHIVFIILFYMGGGWVGWGMGGDMGGGGRVFEAMIKQIDALK